MDIEVDFRIFMPTIPTLYSLMEVLRLNGFIQDVNIIATPNHATQIAITRKKAEVPTQ
jgi:hypothetical protein